MRRKKIEPVNAGELCMRMLSSPMLLKNNIINEEMELISKYRLR